MAQIKKLLETVNLKLYGDTVLRNNVMELSVEDCNHVLNETPEGMLIKEKLQWEPLGFEIIDEEGYLESLHEYKKSKNSK